MNKCLYCGKDVKNKYCDVSCQNKHQNSEKTNKKYGELTSFKVLSLDQVQNRDKIKIKEIINFGYEPYIINDYGKYNKNFVVNEFERLVNYIKNY